jgi:hypothetical protein
LSARSKFSSSWMMTSDKRNLVNDGVTDTLR